MSGRRDVISDTSSEAVSGALFTSYSQRELFSNSEQGKQSSQLPAGGYLDDRLTDLAISIGHSSPYRIPADSCHDTIYRERPAGCVPTYQSRRGCLGSTTCL